MKRVALDSPTDPILDSINGGVFTVHREWRITAFNGAAKRITRPDLL